MEKRLKRTLLRVLAEGGVIFLALDFKVITSDYMLALVIISWAIIIAMDAILMNIPEKAMIWDLRAGVCYFTFFLLVLFLSIYDYTHFKETIPRMSFISYFGLLLMFCGLL